MPIGIVQSVDVDAGTVKVAVQSGPGGRYINRVRLMKGQDVPEYNTRIVVVKDGRNYYCIGTPMAATAAAVEERSEQQLSAGDKLIGDPEGTHIHLRVGGMIAVMADKVTGFIASKANGIIQLMGKMISFDTTHSHRMVRTVGQNTVVDERLAGSPYGTPLSLEMMKYIVKTQTGELALDISAFNNVGLNFIINPLSGNALGPNIAVNIQTPMGPIKVESSGVTGNVNVTAPGIIKVEAKQAVLVNSEGLPIDRVRRAGDICWYTQGMCGGGSSKMFVGEGL